MDVSPPLITLDESTFDDLVAEINPLQECGDHGVQLYVDCVSFVELRTAF